MSFNQYRTNPSQAVSNFKGRTDTPKAWPGTRVATWTNGGLFGGGSSYDGRYEWIAGYSTVASSYSFNTIPAGYESYEIRFFHPTPSAQVSTCWQVNGFTSNYWTNQWASYSGNKWSTSSNAYSENRFSWMQGAVCVSGTVSFVDPTQQAKPIGMSLGSANYSSSYGVVKQLSALSNSVAGSGITTIQVKTTNGTAFPSGTVVNLFGIKSAV